MSNNDGFIPPGPGVWELEVTHFVRPASRATAAIFPDAATAGFRWSMERYGLLLECLDIRVVNRFVYFAARGVGAPPNAKSHPPKLIFKLLTKVHPELRKRIRTVQNVFTTKKWREDVARWDAEWKPAFVREHKELQSVDVRQLGDDALIAHLTNAFDAVRRAVRRHHSFNATAMLPLGDFLVHVREWTGLAPSDVLPLFQGSSRVSRGATDEIQALGQAIQASPDAQTLLASDDPRPVVDALLSRKDAVGDAMRRYIDAAGTQLATGYDLADLTLFEMPELIVENIRSAVTMVEGDRGASNVVVQLEQQIRDRIPAQHRATFDELLEEARFTYRIRDERGYINDAWAGGIARRAILEAGERLVRKGRLHEAHHAVELTPEELVAMLAEGTGPSADETASHAHFRTTHTTADAQLLGGTPGTPPPADWLPPAAARAERAIGIVMDEMFAARDKQSDATKISGFAASHGIVTGIARLVLEPRDMGRVRKGDVLITRSTSPAYNALLPLLLGVVTDRGGTLSHAAVVAREYGIPAVVGTGNATERIRDGARIRIDGATGLVELLA